MAHDDDWLNRMLMQTPDSVGMGATRACNCIGPQRGETLCPCMLLTKMEKERAMLRDGVEIGGKRYDLVPRQATPPVSE